MCETAFSRLTGTVNLALVIASFPFSIEMIDTLTTEDPHHLSSSAVSDKEQANRANNIVIVINFIFPKIINLLILLLNIEI